MSVQQARGSQETVEASLSLTQRLALIPVDEKIALHHRLEAYLQSKTRLSDSILKIVLFYDFEVSPRDLIGRIRSPFNPSSQQTFILRTDNIHQLFQQLIKFGEDFSCSQPVLECVRDAALTQYSLATSQYWLTSDEIERGYEHSYDRTTFYLRVVDRVNTEISKESSPHRDPADLKFPKIHEISAFFEKYNIRWDDAGGRSISISIKNVYLYETVNPFVAGALEQVEEVPNCWRDARRSVEEWPCFFACIARLFFDAIDCIWACFCRERGDE